MTAPRECRPPEGTPDGAWPRPVMPEVIARQRAWAERHPEQRAKAAKFALALCIAEPPHD